MRISDAILQDTVQNALKLEIKTLKLEVINLKKTINTLTANTKRTSADRNVVIGQEAISPDGLGRVTDIKYDLLGDIRIKVMPHVKKYGPICDWHISQITLIKLNRVTV